MGFLFFAPYASRLSPYGNKGGLWFEQRTPEQLKGEG